MNQSIIIKDRTNPIEVSSWREQCIKTACSELRKQLTEYFINSSEETKKDWKVFEYACVIFMTIGSNLLDCPQQNLSGRVQWLWYFAENSSYINMSFFVSKEEILQKLLLNAPSLFKERDLMTKEQVQQQVGEHVWQDEILFP